MKHPEGLFLGSPSVADLDEQLANAGVQASRIPSRSSPTFTYLNFVI
jgi:hypothetical protein